MKTDELVSYIKKARTKGKDDETIRHNLLLAGWDKDAVEGGLGADLDDDEVPKPPTTAAKKTTSKEPLAVVQTFSPRGFEYIIMFIALGVTALSLGSILHDVATMIISGTASDLVAFSPMASAGLIVALPIFAFLFLRLKKLEQLEPKLKFDTSRRRAVQLTLIVSFIIGVGRLIWYIYQLLEANAGTNLRYGYEVTPPAAEVMLLNTVHALITIVIAGSIFAYYWRDLQHKEEK